jgi:hypothetical protein
MVMVVFLEYKYTVLMITILVIYYLKKNDEVMSYHQMREAYLFYTELNKNNEIHFKIYTECISTLSYNRDNFMMWYPMTLDTFLEKFGV